MAFTRTILVTTASGNIGVELVPRLAREPNTKLVLLSRSADKLRSVVPSSTSDHIAIEEGGIADPVWFESVLAKHAVDTVFLCFPGGGSELDTTINALDAMRRAGTVKQCVYVSICGDYFSPAGIEKLSRDCSAGHMLVKIPIERKLRHAEFPFATTILGPSLFFTNDRRARRALMERGVFDEPVHNVSRVSPKDIALAARNVMFAPKGKYDGQKIQIGSKHSYSGKETADLWSKALGKEIKGLGEGPEALDQYEAEHMELFGPSFARDMKLMYESFHKMGFGMSEEEYKLQVEVLGKEAEDYGTWVGESALDEGVDRTFR